MTSLSLDFETRSTVDLTSTGVYPYAAHPDTDIWCMAWAFDDEEPEIWTPIEAMHSAHMAVITPIPQRVISHILAKGEIRAWNAQFERVIWKAIMVKRYGAPAIDDSVWVDSAAEAAAMSLPRSLGQAAHVMGVEEEKDSKGHDLMMRMTRPRKVHDDGRIVWWDVPDRLDKLFEYCKQDVRTERAIAKCLRRLTPREQEVYRFDQRVNDRGLMVDLPLVAAAQNIVDVAVEKANTAIQTLTSGQVPKITNHAALRDWLATQGVDTPSIDKAAVRDLLEGDLTEKARFALQLRSDAGRSSAAKLKSMATAAGVGDRVRGMLFYHGAGTGRWTGRLVQPHNFPRGEIPNIEDYIGFVMNGEYDLLDLLHPAIKIISSMLRSMLIAKEGHDLIAADYSAIEARVLNWLAGQEDMVELFRKYDAAPKSEKPKYDPYRHNAAKLYGIPLEDVLKFPHRQTGKFQELGCGFGMGADKAVSAAKTVYGLDITHEFAKVVVDGYRSTHFYVKQFWDEANDAVIQAVKVPGVVVKIGARKNIKVVKAGAYLYIVLPSGRPLCYPAPRVVVAPTPWGEMRECVEFNGVHPKTKQWCGMRLYGGLIVENIVQAVSRDLLAEGMLRAEAAGYPIVLSVHDEAVAEIPTTFGSVEEFEKLLAALPDWAEGCPVSAEGWRGKRYRK